MERQESFFVRIAPGIHQKSILSFLGRLDARRAEIMKKVAEAKASREAAAKEAEEQRTAFYGNSPLPRAQPFCPR